VAEGEALAVMASRTLPPPSRPKVLAISKLRKCPARVNLHTEQLIEGIRSSLEEGRAVQGITVGVVDGAYYIVDGHARVDGCERAEFVEINVGEVLDLGSVANVVIEHVRRNTRSPMNPIRVLGAVAFLAKEGVADPFRALRLTPVMETAVRVLLMWPKDVLGKFSDLLEKYASRFSDVYAIPHFFATFEDLSFKAYTHEKGAEEELRDVVLHIMRYLESIGDEREFALPGPDQVIALMRDRRRQIKAAAQAAKSSIKERSARKRAPTKEGAGREDGGGIEGNDDDSDDVGYKEPVLMPDKNKSMIECTHCGRPQVVDLKTGHVCPVESVAGGMIDVIRDGDGHRSYALSIKAMKFLGLDRPVEEVSPAKYGVVATDRKSEVDRAIRSAKPASRFVLIIADSAGAEDDEPDDDASRRKPGSSG
jgi:hypothetical protein